MAVTISMHDPDESIKWFKRFVSWVISHSYALFVLSSWAVIKSLDESVNVAVLTGEVHCAVGAITSAGIFPGVLENPVKSLLKFRLLCSVIASCSLLTSGDFLRT